MGVRLGHRDVVRKLGQTAGRSLGAFRPRPGVLRGRVDQVAKFSAHSTGVDAVA